MTATTEQGTRLLTLAKEEKFDELRLALQELKKVNSNCPAVQEAFVRRIAYGSPDLYELFVQKGLDVNLRFQGGRALISAAQAGEAGNVSTLLNLGADPNLRGGAGDTALIRVISKAGLMPTEYHEEFLDTAKALVGGGVQLNLFNMHGKTALDLAVEIGWLELTELLLEQGSRVDMGMSRGAFALTRAARQKDGKLLQLILPHVSNVNATDIVGRTALHYAAEAQLEKNCKLLIEHGACSQILDVEGTSPSVLARTKRMKDLFQKFSSAQSREAPEGFAQNRITGEYQPEMEASHMLSAFMQCLFGKTEFYDEQAAAEWIQTHAQGNEGRIKLVITPHRIELSGLANKNRSWQVTNWGGHCETEPELFANGTNDANENVIIVFKHIGPELLHLLITHEKFAKPYDDDLSHIAWLPTTIA